ncbi:MAG: NAD(P)H-quinone oxidoreductase subunit K, partial [SAR324 cluster bacterium]|nr:NAD(P)H-quinone oxidoreductase subunit K [SAR324 cluster bacterium]
GGMFSADSTTAVRGVDKLIPVDLYLPGCPPRPEAIFDAVIKLRKKVANESISERSKITQTHRYLTIPHKMKRVESKVNGQYLKAKTQLIALNPSLSEEFNQSLKEVQKISEELSSN